MAERRPIVLVGNTLHELKDTDTIANYYNKAEIQTLLNNVSTGAIDVNFLMTKLPVYTKDQVNNIISTLPTLATVYTKTEINSLLNQKASITSVYGKSEVYSKQESYSKLETYPKSQLYSKSEIDGLIDSIGGLTANDIYTKTEINTFLSSIPSMTTVALKTDLNSLRTTIETYVNTNFLPVGSGAVTMQYLNDNYSTKTSYYTKGEVDTKLATIDLSTYATQTWVNNKILDILTGAGSVSIDLSNYYTKSQVTDAINTAVTGLSTGGSVDLSNYYTKTQIDTNISNSFTNYFTKTATQAAIDDAMLNVYTKTAMTAKLEDYYTKSQADAKFSTLTVDLTNYYTKTQVDSLLSTSGGGSGGTINTTLVYTKTEIDTKLDQYIKSTALTNYALLADCFTKVESDIRYYTKTVLYTKSELYNKGEIDSKVQLVTDNQSTVNSAVNSQLSSISNSITTLNNNLGQTVNLTNMNTSITDAVATLNNSTIKPLQLQSYKNQQKINKAPKLTEKDLIVVVDANTKTYTVDYNPDFVMVYLNRNVLYKEEYTATNGTSITFNIDLLASDKIKVFTYKPDYSAIDSLTTVPA